ncbi:MAG: leucine--tRNA ligase [Nitrosopumilus sp. B06]|nr:MAG: leucine--tRNA ligase [Nitrosopumilus sp. B06]
MTVEWAKIEAKWRERWREDCDFETDPNDRKKKFITVAYPYPNSPQHLGHGRTYTIADIHARFYRMRGYNVLFPMGFHYTGTPILGMARRIEAGDEEIISGLRDIFGVPEDVISTFAEPVKIADYFHEEIKTGMIEMGYSIDWRREFTTIDPAYQKFIEWQISSLRDKNLIIQGSHPVGWCPSDENPVSQHDTMGDVEPDFTEYVVVKFQTDRYVVPVATLRPETIFGVTNLWVNPHITYKKITVDGEDWIVSAECAHKLEFLDKKISYNGEIPGSELAGMSATGPHGGAPVPILGAEFVEPETGTGLVMSVPAHAPFDFQALADLKKSGHKTASGIKPVSIINTESYGTCPAQEACEKFGIKDQNDPKLEEATSEIYNKEFYGGVLGEACGRFAGSKVSEAKEKIGTWLAETGSSDVLLELTNAPVRCRCGAECVVKILSNQWFLNYGDAQWKEKATRCLDSMEILPPEITGEFRYVVGWLRERACARQHGMGTRLPWDQDWIVESLSDSVIYMAYYTIARFVNDKTITPDELTGEFLDYVFLGRDYPGVTLAARRMRAEFSYFYPVDSRHSGRDLIPNHLTFFVLNHTALFPEKDWPQQIVVNGSVLMGGKKMSKSMGNIIPLRGAIAKYGADPIRLGIILSAELLQDADIDLGSVSGIARKLEAMLESCSKLRASAADAQYAEDRWILARLYRLTESVTASIEKMRLREALHEILFAFESDMQWYHRRARAKKRDDCDPILYSICRIRVLLLSPFAPHVAEEMWEMMQNSGTASKSEWPAPQGGTDAGVIQSEDMIKKVTEDISNILRIAKIKPETITIYTAGEQKTSAYGRILGLVMSGNTDMGAVMRKLLADPDSAWIKKNPDFVQKTIKDILSDPVETREARAAAGGLDETALMRDELAPFAGSEFGAKVTIYSETDSQVHDPRNKARLARPFKPAILIE